jgi:addiction module RelE/StbE family toxin
MENKEYNLRFTSKAEEDLDEMFEYISNELFSPESAENLMDKIETSIMMLKTFPYSSSYVLDKILRKRGYRRLIVDHYIVFYLVNEKEQLVIIMRILYSARNYQNFL